MKYIFFLLIYFLFAQNTYANNPVESPTFDDILKRIIQDDKYIFDDKNINIKVLRICIFSTFANGKKEAVYLRNMYNI